MVKWTVKIGQVATPLRTQDRVEGITILEKKYHKEATIIVTNPTDAERNSQAMGRVDNAIVQIKRNTDILFEGYIERVKPTGDKVTYTARSFLSLLGYTTKISTNSSAVTEAEYEDKTGAYIIQDLVYNYCNTVDSEVVADYTNITFTETLGGNVKMHTKKVYDIVKTMCSLYDKDMWFTALTAAWSSGGDLSTMRDKLAGCGTQTAGLSFGGDTGANSAVTEEYNGTAWSSGGNLSKARHSLAGCGTQTAGLSFGGYDSGYSNATEEYNGAVWSTGGNLSGGRGYLSGCGTQTAGLSFGGYTGANSAVTEEYNGSVWAAGGNLNTARKQLGGCGTQSAGLSFGGHAGGFRNETEEYNGTVWSSGGSLNNTPQSPGGSGTQTAGLCFGGWVTGVSDITERYDGVLWSVGPSLDTARYTLGGCGTQTSALSFGGYTSTYVVTTEEYDETATDSTSGDISLKSLHVGTQGSGSSGSPSYTLYGNQHLSKPPSVEYTTLSDMYNRIVVIGRGDGKKKIRVTVDDSTSQSTYGVIESSPFQSNMIIDEETARYIGNLILQNKKDESIKVGVELAYYISDLSYGDWVKIEDTHTNLDITKRIVKLTRSFNVNSGETLKITLGDSFYDYESIIKEISGSDIESELTMEDLPGYMGISPNTPPNKLIIIENGKFYNKKNNTYVTVTNTVFDFADVVNKPANGKYKKYLILLDDQGDILYLSGTEYASYSDAEDEELGSVGGAISLGEVIILGDSGDGDLIKDIRKKRVYNSNSYSYVYNDIRPILTFTYNRIWTIGDTMSTARCCLGGCGTQTAGLSFGGSTGGAVSTTEEYNDSAWSAGGNLGTARSGNGGAGTQTAGLSFGGSGPSNVTEEYDGAAWAAGGNLTTARNRISGCGTQTAGLKFGGVFSVETEEYDGAAWTAGGNLSAEKYEHGGAGTQTAGLSFGGYTGGKHDMTEEYDGSAWTTGGTLNRAVWGVRGCGTQTTGVSFGGDGLTNITEEYTGIVWCSCSSLLFKRWRHASCGSQSNALCFGGYGGDGSALLGITELYLENST